MERQKVVEAVARGWCHPETEHLVMNEKLAYAIVDEVMKVDDTANLGCATTGQLLEELIVRAQIGGYDGYRTVDHH